MENVDDLRRLINGYQVTQAIYAAVTLGIPDELAGGPQPVGALAEAVRADETALYRLLRALAAVGVLNEQPDRMFALTAHGERLRRGDDRSLAAWAAFVGRPPHWQAWSDLLYSVTTGENAFRHVHGTGVWEYRRDHPDEGAIFNAAMVAQTRSTDGAIMEAYDFSRFNVIADIGGGYGTLLATVLKAHAHIRGILFDQPHVVEGAPSFLSREGVADRCQIVGGDFFESVPAGADAYLLKSIIHDWLDPEATKILEVCRAAIRGSGRIVLVERVIGPPNEGREAKMADLNMLVAAGGRQRTIDEFDQLFHGAGLRLIGVTPTAAGQSVLEAAM